MQEHKLGNRGEGKKKIWTESKDLLYGWKDKSRTDKGHTCRNAVKVQFRHWFRESDESSEESTKDYEKWSTVDRERKKKKKKRKTREKRSEKKAGVTRKAKNMAGVGPITDKDIEYQIMKTKDYETKNIWAEKNHLARHYKYNQEELDDLKY